MPKPEDFLLQNRKELVAIHNGLADFLNSRQVPLQEGFWVAIMLLGNLAEQMMRQDDEITEEFVADCVIAAIEAERDLKGGNDA